jgi:hypothetical protein
MGLDMYLEGRKHFLRRDYTNPELDVMEDGFPKTEHVLELAYWRKHPNLHRFIVDSFAGGIDNCQPILLVGKDLLAILDAIKSHRLPHGSGFFFGASPHPSRNKEDYDKSVENDVLAFTAAMQWANAPYNKKTERRSIYYQASW